MDEEEKKGAVILRPAQVDSLVPDATNLKMVAKALLDSGLWTNLKNEAGVFAVIEYGRELGIPPVAALNTMCIINGKLTMEAKAMLAVAAQRAAVTWKIDSLTNKSCKMTFSRPGFQPITVSFDEADAQAAGLLTKTSWKTYPRDLYFARCASRGVRQIAPDAVLGLYSLEEMSDVILPAEGDIQELPAKIKPELPAQVRPELPTEVTPALPAEEKPTPKKQAEGPKKTAEAAPQEKSESPLDEIKAEIISLFDVLTQKYIRAPEALLEAIHARLQQVYHVSRAKIPDDLNEKEAITVRNALRNTLEAEQEEEKEKEKGL